MPDLSAVLQQIEADATPGPWEVVLIDDPDEPGSWYAIMGNGIIFARLPRFPGTPKDAEMEANARLIVGLRNQLVGA